MGSGRGTALRGCAKDTALRDGAAEDGRDVCSAETLVGRYASPASLEEPDDIEVTRGICTLLNASGLDDTHKIRLIAGMVAHLADHRPSFADRACVVATVLFGKDEFDVRSKACFEAFAKFLPAGLAGSKNFNSKETSIFDRNELVENDTSRMTAGHRPLFIQEAVRVLRRKPGAKEMLDVHLRMGGILARTSERSFSNHSACLFGLLLDLNTPELYDHQFRSLALLIARDAAFYDRALAVFFENRLETLRFYIIYTFCHVDGLVADGQRVGMHVKFAERLVGHDGAFDPIVQRQVEIYVSRGFLLLSSVLRA